MGDIKPDEKLTEEMAKELVDMIADVERDEAEEQDRAKPVTESQVSPQSDAR